MAELHQDLEHCYGSVKFRRSLQMLPPGGTVEDLRRPIPLTQVKRRPEPEPPAADPPGAPIPLTRRKSGRHKTLPLGVRAVPMGQGRTPTPQRR
jgi:hypothetical protein